ncbi:hypothetical protein Vi05172_g919 [Venturia inaequalis]|nr:hypothetical protein Vi05172_g919 [Venturia inaequalis]
METWIQNGWSPADRRKNDLTRNDTINRNLPRQAGGDCTMSSAIYGKNNPTVGASESLTCSWAKAVQIINGNNRTCPIICSNE